MEQTSPQPAAETALEAPTDRSLRVPCYCEENVWRLAYRKIHGEKGAGNKTFHVVFVTNPKKCAPMFQQLASNSIHEPCFWDYHVILFSASTEKHPVMVHDIDSHLPYPCPAETYLEGVFPTEIKWPDEFRPFFRVIEASVFLKNFSSDRMHMYDSETGTWSATPPTYSIIQAEKASNLSEYMTITECDIRSQSDRMLEMTPLGAVYSLQELKTRFGIN